MDLLQTRRKETLIQQICISMTERLLEETQQTEMLPATYIEKNQESDERQLMIALKREAVKAFNIVWHRNRSN